MNKKCDYFVIESKNCNHFVKIVRKNTKNNSNIMSIKIIEEDEDENEIENISIDFLQGEYCFFSEKIFNILKINNIYGIKFVETKWIKSQEHINKQFWCLLENNTIDNMVAENYEYDIIWSISPYEHYEINMEFLKNIPLQEKLIFMIGDIPRHFVFHKTIVNLIMKAKPKGIEFIPIENNEEI